MSTNTSWTDGVSVVQWSLGAFFVYVLLSLGKAVYNVYFHPLSKFPGPKLAAATTMWKLYVEAIRQRNMALYLRELHGQYGDIVRVGPNELHFSRPSVYHEIYNAKNRWTKDVNLYHIFADEQSTFSLCDYDQAKKRRDITLPLFSRRSIVNIQHLIQEGLDLMCANIENHIKDGKPFNMFRAFRCASIDAIFSICFARSLNALSEPQFEAPLERAMYAAHPVTMLVKHFPVIKTVMSKVPPRVLQYIQPEMKGYLDVLEMIKLQVRKVLTNPQSLVGSSHRTVYHEFLKALDENQLDISEQSLRDEALLFINAGTDTVSDALSVGTLNILDNPEVHAKLREEILKAWPKLDEPPRYEELENLPYLRAVIRESLRFSHGVVHPMPRIVPDEGTRLSEEYIPGGTVVSISNIFVHWNDEIFPDPHSFKPERWLGKDEESLDMWLVSFSKGPRSCLGTNLAYCELYMTLAHLFRRFELRLDGVRASDWKWADCYLPHYMGPELNVWAKARVA